MTLAPPQGDCNVNPNPLMVSLSNHEPRANCKGVLRQAQDEPEPMERVTLQSSWTPTPGSTTAATPWNCHPRTPVIPAQAGIQTPSRATQTVAKGCTARHPPPPGTPATTWHPRHHLAPPPPPGTRAPPSFRRRPESSPLPCHPDRSEESHRLPPVPWRPQPPAQKKSAKSQNHTNHSSDNPQRHNALDSQLHPPYHCLIL